MSTGGSLTFQKEDRALRARPQDFLATCGGSQCLCKVLCFMQSYVYFRKKIQDFSRRVRVWGPSDSSFFFPRHADSNDVLLAPNRAGLKNLQNPGFQDGNPGFLAQAASLGSE